MTAQPERPLKIELTLKASQPELLEGLEVWLRLGLITHAQVRQLSQTYLVSPLPPPAPVTAPDEGSIEEPPTVAQTKAVPEIPVASAPAATKPSLLTQMWQSLRDELSVRWLLFLGVFLVVVSSGVLAATQWQNFPAVGQYGVLWTYTLIFWLGSFWAGRQRNLQLTAQTLQWVTLLLVPVNFWAMASFGLWGQPGERVVMAIAAVTLTAMALRYPTMRRGTRPTIYALLLLGLSYLHWGWQSSGWPLVAVYLGTVATATFLPKPLANLQDEQQANQTNSAIAIYALAVLLGRGIFVEALPIEQLGLAIGICGWLLARLGQPSTAEASPSNIWEGLGGVLLLIGWGVAVAEDFPWQATAVSGLGLGFFASRLQRFWRRRDLFAIFAISLQLLGLLWRLVPAAGREDTVAILTQLTSAEAAPWTLLSLALFPQVIGMVLLSDWTRNQPRLARFGERLTLSFGVLLSLISLGNPAVRSLNLLLSTITLATVTHRWSPTRTNLVYLTHIAGLLTLGCAIDWRFPNLSEPVTAGILLVVMALEWGFSSLTNSPFSIPVSPVWQRSAWQLGFVLAGLSYALLWDRDANPTLPQESGLLWLLTPLTLTGVASRTGARRTQATRWSVATLGIAQALTLGLPGVRLIGLSFATGLMLVNTRYWRHKTAAAITLGFALSFVGTLLWEGIPGLPRLAAADWFLVGAIATLVCWLLRHWLQQRTGTLAALYAEAADEWAVALCSFELLMLTLQSLGSYLELIAPSWKYLVASALIGAAILYRCRQQSHTVVYSIGWTVELLIAQGVLLAGGSTLDLATANIILGLVTLFVSDGWFGRRQALILSSVEILPLLYALLGMGLRNGHFTPWTGLLTLGAALTGVGVGRRRAAWKPLTYLSLVGISAAWYELVIYQLLQAEGGAPADALTILAVVAMAIAFAYRLLAGWRSRRGSTLLSLSVAEINLTAHTHWAIGSLLMVVTACFSLETTPRLKAVGIAVSLLLAVYALLQGRQRVQAETPEAWVYLGIMEVVGTVAYGRIIWDSLSVLDPWFALMAGGAALGMYQLPWERWGWSRSPWQQAALVLPIFTVWATAGAIATVSLLVIAGFYAWVAQRRSTIRFTYVSVALVDWAIARWFSDLQLTHPLWFATLIGLSLLYVAQFDPDLQRPEARHSRHYLRLLGGGAICLVALFFDETNGITPAVISLIAIFAGLTLRVRAFLFIGTATFLLSVFNQLVILSFRYSFVKWVVGLVAGILFIGIAANFETRRDQIASVFRNSRSELNTWD